MAKSAAYKKQMLKLLARSRKIDALYAKPAVKAYTPIVESTTEPELAEKTGRTCIKCDAPIQKTSLGLCRVHKFYKKDDVVGVKDRSKWNPIINRKNLNGKGNTDEKFWKPIVSKSPKYAVANRHIHYNESKLKHEND